MPDNKEKDFDYENPLDFFRTKKEDAAAEPEKTVKKTKRTRKKAAKNDTKGKHVSIDISFPEASPEEEMRLAELERNCAGVKAKPGYKVNRAIIESKSKRFNLLLQPSLYEILKIRVEHDPDCTSVNEYITKILKEYLGIKEDI